MTFASLSVVFKSLQKQYETSGTALTQQVPMYFVLT